MTELPTREDIQAALPIVYDVMLPTPQICWPMLSAEVGAEVWVKHENHTPAGAFKIRGGQTFVDSVISRRPGLRGLIAATRGNHGQSVALAARYRGLRCTVVVPRGNSVEKNAAMVAQGAELVEHGHDFQAALEAAEAMAVEQDLQLVPSYDFGLLRGVATYGWELLEALPDLETLYVPIGLGSGFAGCVAAREALGRSVEVVGVVAANADCYARSFESGRLVATESADTFADGVACRVPSAAALEVVEAHAARVLRVEEEEISEAMRRLYRTTHNLAEGAGAVALAGLWQERARVAGRRVGVVCSGGNIDRELFLDVLSGTL